MNVTSNCKKNIELMNSHLKVKESYDIVERELLIGEKNAVIYFINGFIKSDIMEDILKSLFKITPEKMNSFKNLETFMKTEVPHVSAETQKDLEKSINALLSGQTIMFIEGYNSCIILDLRTYPGQDASQPEKEKTLRGGRDAFIEKLVSNSALIRRRIRDPRLIFEMHSVGSISKTDVCIAYIDGVCDKKIHDLIVKSLSEVDISALTVGDQSLIDIMCKKNWFNPFPKVRYTERPDVAAAHIVEGKIVLMVDNSPNVMILPTGVFDFLQDVNDYYFPFFTGNYLRIIRNLILLSTIVVTPLYLLFINGNIFLPKYFDFLKPQDYFVVPMVFQFLILELSIDGLKLASLNTPSPLGNSLSVISGLIVGEYAINTGWFTSQSILYMAVVAIGGFCQPSIEMNYAFKFMRVLLIILCGLFGFWGFIGGLILIFLIMITTKTIAGDNYFYPLIPFNWKKLKNLIFRTRISKEVQ